MVADHAIKGPGELAKSLVAGSAEDVGLDEDPIDEPSRKVNETCTNSRSSRTPVATVAVVADIEA